MTEKYDHSKIEKKWQKVWEKKKPWEAQNPSSVLRTSALSRRKSATKPKFYGLVEFPYPSGDGLHVGHVRGYTAMDVIARKRRAERFNVLYPIGWDAFGLPTENYAVKTGLHPKIITKKNTDIFRRQLKSLGISFDWSREIDTTDPAYYKWTQWIFLQFFKKGLAYKAQMPINWCLSCKIGLANEEVVDGRCERCGGMTEKRDKEQWMLAITRYADRLDKDLDSVDYLPQVVTQQRNWIGSSRGAEIEFNLQLTTDNLQKIKVFTTRPDTLFGATYLVLSPEHPLIEKLRDNIKNFLEISAYAELSSRKSEMERLVEGREKTGVKIEGITAINPANDEEVPVFVADYVLSHYGTGAIMAVPAHDGRDFEFARQHNLPIKQVILTGMTTGRKLSEFDDKNVLLGEKFDNSLWKEHYASNGVLINSGKFNGMSSEKAKNAITKFVGGKLKTTYKLHDWVFSRQRYWGEPIPLIFCNNCKKLAETINRKQLTIDLKSQRSKVKGQRFSCGETLNPGWTAVPGNQLPVKLPDIKNYKPTDTGDSPLANVSSWVNVKCPKCGGKAKRETDVMPNWAGSSWYYLRYTDHKNKKELASMKNLKYWLGTSLPRSDPPAGGSATGVDWYNGGFEHTTLHLLYSRFWHKFLYDIKAVPGKEPYKKRTSHGIVLADNGQKMSKSKGNIINPDTIVKKLGADTLRLYELFMGPFDQTIAWNQNSVAGCRRFVERVWKLQNKLTTNNQRLTNKKLETLTHKTIKKVSEDIEEMKFNTAISALMQFSNELERLERLPLPAYRALIRLLAPFAPHMTEEIWSRFKLGGSVHGNPWPKFDKRKIIDTVITLAVSVNGKLRGTLPLPAGASKEEAIFAARNSPAIEKWLSRKNVRQVVYVPGKIINFVVE